jgi:hypothetical protein
MVKPALALLSMLAVAYFIGLVIFKAESAPPAAACTPGTSVEPRALLLKPDGTFQKVPLPAYAGWDCSAAGELVWRKGGLN